MYEDIREKFKSVISYSQNIPDPQIDYIFREWEINKAKFIERFGGLIYEWSEPIEFTLDDNQKRMRAMEFATTVSDTFNNPALAEFIDENLDSFFENKVSKSLGEVPVGMKLLKAFKYFEPNKAALRSIQDMASNIIQENKIKGTLCFSVHPLDFLSSSENTYNWRSCHALDGEYRAGNLSYMVDSTTFMVYLKGADNQNLYGFGPVEWNSKKWRMLIHAADDDSIMFAGRQYPFSSKSGIDTVLNIYNNLMMIGKDHPWSIRYNKYGSWRADYVDSYVPFDATNMEASVSLNSQYLIYANQLIDLNKIVVEGPNCLNYNDILKSTCYNYPYYAIYRPYDYHSVDSLLAHPIVVGAEVPCLHCGEELIHNTETMRCDHCELQYGTEENDVYTSCDCCGARIYVDDGICVGDDGDIICDSCFHQHAFVCDCCGNVYYDEDKVFISDGNDEDSGLWYCRGCYEDMD